MKFQRININKEKQDHINSRIETKWSDYIEYRFCKDIIEEGLTKSDILNILQDLMRESDNIWEIHYISKLIIQKSLNIKSDIYILSEHTDQHGTYNFSMKSMSNESKLDDNITMKIIQDEIVYRNNYIYFPCKGKVSIKSELDYPKNINDIIAAMLVINKDHSITKDMVFFLERYARRVGNGIHHGLLMQYNQQLVKHILEMLTIASHDLRSPLNSIAIGIKILSKGIYGNLDPVIHKEIDKLYHKTKRLLGIMENYLCKTNIFHGNINIHKQNLDLRQDIIDPMLEEFAENFKSHQITLDESMGGIPDRTIIISADKLWLQNVYRNLFHNILKYGDKGCSMAYGFEDKGDYYQFNVFNSGQPIPQEYRDRLFNKFARGNIDSTKATSGTGIGLYFIKEIINKHGGQIWYEPLHNGSNFVFTLPKQA